MPTREEWLKERQSGIGGSDAASVLGMSPWKSAYQLWAEKTGQIEPPDLSNVEAVEWGLLLEPLIGEAFAERTGRGIAMWPPFTILRNLRTPCMFCTPDASQFVEAPRPADPAWLHDLEGGTRGLLQIKATGFHQRGEWAVEPPLHYQIQLQHEMACAGAEWGTLVALIGGQQLVWMDQQINRQFVAALSAKCEEFWGWVMDRTPPPVDGSAGTAEVLKKLHPKDNGETVLLPEEAVQWDRELQSAKAAIKAATELQTTMENQLKEAIGDASFGDLPDGSGRYSWKWQARKGYVVEDGEARIFRRSKAPK